MGRRNEPKLDELKRLLKRLETMEVDSKLEGSRKSPAEVTQPASGYVGALRGAVSVDEVDTRGSASQHPGTYDSYDDDDDELPRSSRSGQRSSGPASVVLGAATAAVVSSVVAIGLVLYTADKDKAGDVSNRLSFVAPPEPTTPASRPVSTPEQHGNTQTLLQNADIYIRRGNLVEARRSLEEAAKLGSGVAALTLGAMYDPTRVAEFGNLGVKADPTLARAWYERAKSLGVVEANERLQELAAR
jgi:hypothetical protein